MCECSVFVLSVFKKIYCNLNYKKSNELNWQKKGSGAIGGEICQMLHSNVENYIFARKCKKVKLWLCPGGLCMSGVASCNKS